MPEETYKWKKIQRKIEKRSKIWKDGKQFGDMKNNNKNNSTQQWKDTWIISSGLLLWFWQKITKNGSEWKNKRSTANLIRSRRIYPFYLCIWIFYQLPKPYKPSFLYCIHLHVIILKITFIWRVSSFCYEHGIIIHKKSFGAIILYKFNIHIHIVYVFFVFYYSF